MDYKTFRELILEKGNNGASIIEDIEKQKFWIPPKVKNIRKFTETISILPLNLYKIVFLVLEKGVTNLEYISKKLNIPIQEAKIAIDFLTTYRYLEKIHDKKTKKDFWMLGDVYWLNERFPAGPVIPEIYQFNLISDQERTKFFQEVINNTVKKGDIVLDLGAGSGILSMMSAKKGAKVYSYEIDEGNYNVAKKLFRMNNLEDNIEIFKEDIFLADFPTNADVIICEMFDTALVAELQVQAMNRAIEFLNDNGKVIPERSVTTIELVTDNTKMYGFEFPLIHYQAYGNPPPVDILSEEYIVHDINFYQKNDEKLIKEIKIKSNKDGILNAIRFKTYVYYGNKKLSPSEWFNPPIIYPVKPIKIKKDDNIFITIYLMFGGGWDTAKIKINKEGVK